MIHGNTIKQLLLALPLLVIGELVFAQEAKRHLRDFNPKFTISSFKVYGKCDSCTLHILNAVAVKGVKSAYWHKEQQQLTIQYDRKKIKLDYLHWLLANAGYGTDKRKATK